MSGFIELMLKDRKKNKPKTGFNVCGLDDFEEPGERIYLIKHFEDKKEAESFSKSHGDDTIIISSDE